MNLLYKYYLKNILCNGSQIIDAENIKKEYFSQLAMSFCEKQAIDDELTLIGRKLSSSERQNIVSKLLEPRCGYIGIGCELKTLRNEIKAFDKFYSLHCDNQILLLQYLLSQKKDEATVEQLRELISLDLDILDIPDKFFILTAPMLEVQIKDWNKELI